MILAAHQPHYLPWLGYLDKLDRADIFVLLDDVQYEVRGWQNRNRIRSPKGSQWLTVPVHAHRSDRLMDVAILKESSWQKSHSKNLEFNYQRAQHFSFLWDFLKVIYEKEWIFLVELNIRNLEIILEVIGIKKKIVRSSTLNLRSHASQRLVELCKYFQAEKYLSGDGAKAYLDETLFAKEGIEVEFQQFSHPTYLQYPRGKGGFLEGLSCVDLIFNHGPESLKILRSARI